MLSIESITPKLIKIKLFESYGYRSLILFRKIPSNITTKKNSLNLEPQKIGQSSLLLKLPANLEKKAIEYSLILKIYKKENIILKKINKLFKRQNNNLGYIELIRQTPRFLRKFCKTYNTPGYFILGRKHGKILQKKTLSFVKKNIKRGHLSKSIFANIKKVILPKKFENISSEIVLAAKVMTFLQKRKFRFGKSNITYASYLELPIHHKLSKNIVLPGNFSCQWLRDLFLEIISCFQEVKVRSVDAFNYISTDQSIVSSSHALCEVFCKSNNQWVLVDPWNSSCYQDNKKNYLNSLDIQNGKPYSVEKFFYKKNNTKIILKSKSTKADMKLNIKKNYHIPPLSFYFDNLIITKFSYETKKYGL